MIFWGDERSSKLNPEQKSQADVYRYGKVYEWLSVKP